jgi:hypothetical protein
MSEDAKNKIIHVGVKMPINIYEAVMAKAKSCGVSCQAIILRVLSRSTKTKYEPPVVGRPKKVPERGSSHANETSGGD